MRRQRRPGHSKCKSYTRPNTSHQQQKPSAVNLDYSTLTSPGLAALKAADGVTRGSRNKFQGQHALTNNTTPKQGVTYNLSSHNDEMVGPWNLKDNYDSSPSFLHSTAAPPNNKTLTQQHHKHQFSEQLHQQDRADILPSTLESKPSRRAGNLIV